MPVEMRLWRVDDKPVRLNPGGMPTEARLEELIEAEPTILGEPLLIIGRQVATRFGKIIDLLAVDADGVLHVLELKKDKTPREVVAQVLDYGSWVRSLAHEDVLRLFADYGKGGAFEAAFQQRFDTPSPEELNTGHRLTIIASAVDVATERIVEYLAGEYGVPVNVVFFRYFEDEGHRYLARTWLIDQDRAPEPTGGGGQTCGSWQNTTTPSMYLDLSKVTGSDPGTVDETTYSGVGDTSGQFSVVNGMYKYNLDSSQIGGAGGYTVTLDPSGQNGGSPVPVTNAANPSGIASFTLK
jgi:hypothetical protein